MTISHIAINSSDVKDLTAFYLAALKPLGYAKRVEPAPDVVGMGPKCGAPPFWIAPSQNASKEKGDITHIAFAASNRQVVRDFHAAALKAGAKCNGPPGLRKQYFPTYYAAFVLDPEGRNIEAHCMSPAFISEPFQRTVLLGAVGAIVAVAAWAYRNHAF